MLSLHTLGIFAMSNASLCIASHSHRWMPVKLDLFAREEIIDLLQCKIARFGEEEVNKREEAKVENYKFRVSCCYCELFVKVTYQRSRYRCGIQCWQC